MSADQRVRSDARPVMSLLAADSRFSMSAALAARSASSAAAALYLTSRSFSSADSLVSSSVISPSSRSPCACCFSMSDTFLRSGSTSRATA